MNKLKCIVCNKEFEVTTYEINTGRKYCSRACGHEARKALVTLTCAMCKKEFQVSPVYAKRGAKFCSFDCRNASIYAREKFLMFKQDYPDIKIKVVYKQEYIKLINTHREYISNLEEYTL